MQVKHLLKKQWLLPEQSAQRSVDEFLQKFRQCPENPNIDLDRWRTLLWSAALENPYQDLAGNS